MEFKLKMWLIIPVLILFSGPVFSQQNNPSDEEIINQVEEQKFLAIKRHQKNMAELEKIKAKVRSKKKVKAEAQR